MTPQKEQASLEALIQSGEMEHGKDCFVPFGGQKIKIGTCYLKKRKYDTMALAGTEGRRKHQFQVYVIKSKEFKNSLRKLDK